MKLTAGYLKQILQHLDDDVIIADLQYGNDEFKPFSGIKRLLLLKDESENKGWGGDTFLVINGMGSHFSKEGKQEGLVFKDHFDEDKTTLKKDNNEK